MQRYNKAHLGGAGGGVGAALAQLIVIYGWSPPEAEMAITVILAAALGWLFPRFGAANT